MSVTGQCNRLYSCSLAPLVRKIRDTQIETIVNTLATNMFSDSERLRDISSVGKGSANSFCAFN